MSAIRLGILGIGSMRCGPPIAAALAGYFGERPLEITVYDPDEERAELMFRLMRTLLLVNRSSHLVALAETVEDCAEGTDRLILALDPNGARCLLRGDAKPGTDRALAVQATEDAVALEQALPLLLDGVPTTPPLLSLLPPEVWVPRPTYYRLEWPIRSDESSLPEDAHQILRWVRGDEMPYPLLQAHERSPLSAWLEDVDSADFVLGNTGRD